MGRRDEIFYERFNDIFYPSFTKSDLSMRDLASEWSLLVSRRKMDKRSFPAYDIV